MVFQKLNRQKHGIRMIKLLLIGIFLISISGCSSTSKHYKMKKNVNPFWKKPQIVEIDVIEQKGNIKAEHPTGAKGESELSFKIPEFPVRVDY